ncbi:MAG: sulfite exporter TauE/SafE family protein [Planctomycetaceae bacterium]|jgi:uncharacterized membrane protein YfcA|nr:sulfite exporter TauE/SafE family protein [Planctomycetaceae bacterium]
MNEWVQIFLVGIIVFGTHALEGITGFGCTVLALPFIAMLLGIKVAVPVLAVLAWILAGYIVLVSWKNIVWKEYLFIVVYVGIGLPIGMLLFDYLPENILKGLLSLFMIGIGIHGMKKTINKNDTNLSPESISVAEKNLLMRGVLFLGGIVHGAFVSGGPFVVLYASKALPNKSLFRVSLCLLWFTMNTIWILRFSLFDQQGWTPEIGWVLIITLPFLISGMLLGNRLHHYVSDYYFRLIVYGMIIISGMILVLSVV